MQKKLVRQLHVGHHGCGGDDDDDVITDCSDNKSLVLATYSELAQK